MRPASCPNVPFTCARLLCAPVVGMHPNSIVARVHSPDAVTSLTKARAGPLHHDSKLAQHQDCVARGARGHDDPAHVTTARAASADTKLAAGLACALRHTSLAMRCLSCAGHTSQSAAEHERVVVHAALVNNCHGFVGAVHIEAGNPFESARARLKGGVEGGGGGSAKAMSGIVRN